MTDTKQTSFTPGPWVFSFESSDPEWAVVTTEGGAVIANVNADHRQEANARLITAAPAMFEALTAALPVLEAMQRLMAGHAAAAGMGGDGPLLDNVRAALALATGKEG